MTAALASIDRAFTLWIDGARHPLLDACAVLLASRWAIAAAVLLSLAAVAARPRAESRRAAVLTLLAALLAVACADGSGHLLKLLVARPRPCHTIAELHPLVGCGDSFSFPSNHAANAFALATVLALRTPRWRWIAFAAAAIAAYARLHVGAHYLSDVLAGAALGLAVGNVVARTLPMLEPGSWRAVAARTSQWPSG